MTLQPLNILIADDETELRNSLNVILHDHFKEKYLLNIFHAENGQTAVDQYEKSEFNLVIMDVKMPVLDGLLALKKIKKINPAAFVVILTAHANINDAVLATKEGAYDYLEKPLQVTKLLQLVDQCLSTQELVNQISLSNPIMDDDIDSDMVGGSLKMKKVYELIHRLSYVETTVLIRGENGTGKELVARAIHNNSNRKKGPFVAINCGAIADQLMESELFGHEKGAFTGAIQRRIGQFQNANNGTLFLDEIGELKLELQVKLLRVLQEKTFTPVGSSRELKTTARIIAATNRNLEKLIQEGLFREDLFYRLNVLPIFMPPLRDRIEDIHSLTLEFIKKFRALHPMSPVRTVSDSSLDILKSYFWPGNIRELENTIERAFIIENSDIITPESLPETILNYISQLTAKSNLSSIQGYDQFKEDSEKEFIIAALKKNQGKINQTVANAGIPKNTLLRKIKKYNIQVKDYN